MTIPFGSVQIASSEEEEQQYKSIYLNYILVLHSNILLFFQDELWEGPYGKR